MKGRILLIIAFGYIGIPSEGLRGTGRGKPIVLCPAQFSVEKDYRDLELTLEKRGYRVFFPKISRLGWLRIAPATFTVDYWKGELKPKKCLQFYFEGVDDAITRMTDEYGGKTPEFGVIGHSIGGWIARAYFGEVVDKDVLRKLRKFATIGTPHLPPPEGPFRTLDQTRGLLTYVNQNFPGRLPTRLGSP